jgi:hypothetical protein
MASSTTVLAVPAPEPTLEDGSRVDVIGSGPAGSLFATFLSEMAGRVDVKLQVDIYESRTFNVPGPAGCNMCGGIVSETLVQNLAIEGVNLPTGVVQRGIQSCVLLTEVGSTRERRDGVDPGLLDDARLRGRRLHVPGSRPDAGEGFRPRLTMCSRSSRANGGTDSHHASCCKVVISPNRAPAGHGPDLRHV